MTDHLSALQLRLSHERERLRRATGREAQLRAVWVSQCEKEIARERQFLGLAPESLPALTDDELLAELGA